MRLVRIGAFTSFVLLVWGCAPVSAQSTFPGRLPLGCTNGQIAIYATATNTWNCGNAAGGGDVLAVATLTANLPVIGAGGTTITVGTRSGNTTAYVTTTGAQTSGRCVEIDASGNHIAAAAACGVGGGVTSVAQSFTGGLISVAGSPITTSGTLALTVAGTSGGVPYFSSSSAWASSAALAANALVIGGGAGAAPATTTTGTGVVTALGVNVGSAGAFVVNGGALGTPSSGTLTNATGLPTAGLLDGAVTVGKMANMATGTVLSNITGGSAAPVANTYADFLNAASVPTLTCVEAEGQIIYYDGADWTCLDPGTSGHFLKTQGAGDVPVWAAVSATGCATSGSATQVLTDDGAGGCTSNAAMLYGGGTLTLGTAGSVAGIVALKNATSGTVNLTPVTGALGTVTASLPARTGTVALETGSTFTTGTIILPFHFVWTAAVCQNATASGGYSTPTTLGAAATCVSTTAASGDPAYASATFVTGGNNTEAHGHFPLFSDWTGAIDLTLKWNSLSNASGDVVWQVQFGCTATGEVPTSISFNANTFTATANQTGTTAAFNISTKTGLTTTGCAAGEQAFFIVHRDTDTAGDTLDQDVQLLQIDFTYRRTVTIGG